VQHGLRSRDWDTARESENLVREGKEGPEFMERVVYQSLGRHARKAVVGPGRGLDNAIVALGHGRVMVVTVDPVSAMPTLGMSLSARLSVHLIASDLTASGTDPEFATFSYNFPPSLRPSEREEYVRSVGAECRRLGIAIVAGNTGSYPGGGFTVIGAGTMFGFATEKGYVTPSMARVGDSILMTKHAAIEATASLAYSFPKFVAERAGRDALQKARNMVNICTTVSDAQVARRAGLGDRGVTSMHDATEGGVLGALDEMASASDRAFSVDARMIPISEEAESICASFGLDPLRTMGEGALLVTCRPERVPELERVMFRAGIPINEVGRVEDGEGLILSHRGGRRSAFKPGPDKYWEAYERASRSGLR
jgi:hydrogenase expression/formation protein HypE